MITQILRDKTRNIERSFHMSLVFWRAASCFFFLCFVFFIYISNVWQILTALTHFIKKLRRMRIFFFFHFLVSYFNIAIAQCFGLPACISYITFRTFGYHSYSSIQRHKAVTILRWLSELDESAQSSLHPRCFVLFFVLLCAKKQVSKSDNKMLHFF